jgi:hypothetical protein
MPNSSPEYSHALTVALRAPELDEGTSELDEGTSELDESPPSLLELSSFDEEGDSEQAKTVREIAAANVGIVILIMVSPWLIQMLHISKNNILYRNKVKKNILTPKSSGLFKITCFLTIC